MAFSRHCIAYVASCLNFLLFFNESSRPCTSAPCSPFPGSGLTFDAIHQIIMRRDTAAAYNGKFRIQVSFVQPPAAHIQSAVSMYVTLCGKPVSTSPGPGFGVVTSPCTPFL